MIAGVIVGGVAREEGIGPLLGRVAGLEYSGGVMVWWRFLWWWYVWRM